MAAKANSKNNHLPLVIQFLLLLQASYFLLLISVNTLIQLVLNKGLISLNSPSWEYMRVLYQIPLSIVVFCLGIVLTITAIIFYSRQKIFAWLTVVYSLFSGIFYNWALTQWSIQLDRLSAEAAPKTSLLDFNQKFMFLIPILLPLVIFLFLDRKNSSSRLSYSRFKSFVFGLTLLIFGFIPVGYYSYATYVSWHPTYNYEKLQKTLSYHLYFPTKLPNDKALIQNFNIVQRKDLAWSKTVIGTPIYLPLKQDNPGIMIIFQTKLPYDFDLKSYTRKNYTDFSAYSTKLALSNEFNDYIFLKSQKGPASTRILLLVTKENTLIEIDGVSFTDEDYFLVANGLK